eukprot:CAMPEP_0113947896 /NCGR_PEP_ID=MMETSP1339-20121228/67337_1 /TAXON_ID=94617 /ORGANISM="Fibrocapsa japonica" /LENGTH=168 /DNA_ID=CAMNT_0000954701 /DNA_START=1 /DNA_END=504 /DNA_ORIENTATION=- /assembly_acc=CAM_ASM_000762
MAPPRKKHAALNKKSGSCDNPMRPKPAKQRGGKLRDKSTINRLKMYRSSGPIRNKEGKITGGAFMMRDRAGDRPLAADAGRVAPNRKWFGNTRVIGQEELDRFRHEMTCQDNDPYSVVLRRRKLPLQLLETNETGANTAADPNDVSGANGQVKGALIAAEGGFSKVFG